MSYIFVDTSDKFRTLTDHLQRGNDIVYADIESTGLDWFTDKILLFQVMIDDVIYVTDIRRLGTNFLAHLVRTLKAHAHTVVFHNAKFDLKFIYDKTKILLNNIYDTMGAEIIVNAGIGKKLYSLAELAEKYSDTFMDKESRNEFINFPDDSPFTESMLQYSALDVKVLKGIYEAQHRKFLETRQLPITQLEMKLLPVVAKMEYDGIRLDSKMWLEIEKEAIVKRDILSEDFNKDIVDFLVNTKYPNALKLVEATHLLQKNKFTKKTVAMLEEITDLSNFRGWLTEHFNPKSPQQLLSIFHLMKIKCKDTNEKTLQDFTRYSIVNKLLEIRKVNKQIDQYGSNFLRSIHKQTGKIHTEYFTLGTRTGRFSSNNPNLQNVPIYGGYRECFLPDEGYVFAIVDYSQQEFRLAGAVSGEPIIINAYKNGSDMHTATASVRFGKPLHEITKDERGEGKTLNFAIIYGTTEWGLKRNFNISLDDARKMLDDYWKGYPRLSKFMEIAGEKILELGYSRTPMGRIRYNVEKPLFMNTQQFSMWQDRVLREGKNHIIQGGGADILKLAMVEIFEKNPFGDLLKLTLQIHDELVAQVHKSIKNEGLEFIKSVMLEVEQRYLGEIPAAVEGDCFERWTK